MSRLSPGRVLAGGIAVVALAAIASFGAWAPRSAAPAVLAGPSFQEPPGGFAPSAPAPGQPGVPGTPPVRPPGAQAITVAGDGEARAVPDIAIFTVGVVQVAPTAAEAMGAVSERLSAVIAGAKARGVEEKDIQTSGLSLQPIFRSRTPQDNRPPEIEAYRASNNVTITVRDLPRASAVLDSATSNGANAVSGLRFTASNLPELRAQALADAVRNARHNADAMAAAAGLRIDGVRSLDEEGAASPVPRPVEALRAGAPADVAPPVEAGELTVRARVRGVFSFAPS